MQKAIEIQSRGLTLRGMMHVPDNRKGKVPAVAIFHGFTGHKMESHFIFVKLSRALEKNGIASFRFDFAGSGESDGEFRDMTILGELADANNILDYVKTQEFVDLDKIGVIGLSMGGAVGSMLASERKDDIKALCLWAPAGNMGEIIKEQMKDNNIDAIRKAGWVDIGGFCLGIDFIDEIIGLNIFERAKNYDKNVLLIHGDKDQTVDIKTSNRYMEYYKDRGCLYVVKGGDHTFTSKALEDEVIGKTVSFITEELK